jgi:hypothetical protein
MATLAKGKFGLNLGVVKIEGEFSEDDRQCAWELYTELATRVAVTGKPRDPKCSDFSGELYVESLDSLYAFFREARQIMRRFPVGKIGATDEYHLGAFIGNALFGQIRPFLEKWQVKYRYWWQHKSNGTLSLAARQKEFPDLKEFLSDWMKLRFTMRQMQVKLAQVYKLPRFK